MQFSHYEYFDAAMREFLGADGWNHCLRQAWVWMRDRFVPYPFQNNVHRLPVDDLEKCILGLVENLTMPRNAASNFREWIDTRFGRGIADIFMVPYNEKVWAHPLDQMNAIWVGERVAPVDLSRVIHNVLHKTDDLAWGPNNTFAYPRDGGTGAIWSACASTLPPNRLLFGRRVVSVDLERHRCTLDDGSVIEYDTMISTMPINELLEMSRAEHLLDSAAKGLLHSSTNVVGLGLAGRAPEALRDKSWMYFPETNCPFYRATVFSNFAESNVPDPEKHWSLMFEVSESRHKPVDHSTLIQDVIEGALSTRLISNREAIISVWTRREEYGYPTPGLHRDEALEKIIPYFEGFGVHSRGRFGMWKYEVSNQDHSFMQGVEVVERLLGERCEITAFDADHANAQKHPWPFERWVSA